MELVKSFTNELTSLYEQKPPISKVKMTALTKGAIRAIKFYKHVVQSVEKFLQKCRVEYKVPGLYVIDSIVRQSRHQFGADRDVFAPRFAKNLSITFYHIFKCPPEDKSKVIRVLNLWQKNQVFLPETIQPIFDLADPDHPASRAIEQQLISKPPESADQGGTKEASTGHHQDEGGGTENQPGTVSADPALVAQLQQLQTLLKPGAQQLYQHQHQQQHHQQQFSGGSVSDTDGAVDSVDNGERPKVGAIDGSLESLSTLLSNPDVVKQLQNLQQTLQQQQQQQQHQHQIPQSQYPAQQQMQRPPDQADRAKILRQREDEFDRRLAQTVGSLPFASEIDFQPRQSVESVLPEPPIVGMDPLVPAQVAVAPPALPVSDMDLRSEPALAPFHMDVEPAGAGLQAPPSLLQVDAGLAPTANSHDNNNGAADHSGNDVDERLRSRDGDKDMRRRSRSRSRSWRRRGRSRSNSRSRSKAGRRSRRDRSRSRDRDRSRRSRSRDRERSRRSRSRDRGRSRRSWSRDREEDSQRQKQLECERERKRRGLPVLKSDHLTVCSTTLWVGHLSKLVQEEDLSDLFGSFGDVLSIGLIPPRGCAFICMNRRQDAARALAKLKNHKLQGKPITIAWAAGKGMKGKDFKDYWETDLGCSYIPYAKLSASSDLGSMEEGGMVDEDSLPDWLKGPYEELHSAEPVVPLTPAVPAPPLPTEPQPPSLLPQQPPLPPAPAFVPAPQPPLLPTPINIPPMLTNITPSASALAGAVYKSPVVAKPPLLQLPQMVYTPISAVPPATPLVNPGDDEQSHTPMLVHPDVSLPPPMLTQSQASGPPLPSLVPPQSAGAVLPPVSSQPPPLPPSAVNGSVEHTPVARPSGKRPSRWSDGPATTAASSTAPPLTQREEEGSSLAARLTSIAYDTNQGFTPSRGQSSSTSRNSGRRASRWSDAGSWQHRRSRSKSRDRFRSSTRSPEPGPAPVLARSHAMSRSPHPPPAAAVEATPAMPPVEPPPPSDGLYMVQPPAHGWSGPLGQQAPPGRGLPMTAGGPGAAVEPAMDSARGPGVPMHLVGPALHMTGSTAAAPAQGFNLGAGPSEDCMDLGSGDDMEKGGIDGEADGLQPSMFPVNAGPPFIDPCATVDAEIVPEFGMRDVLPQFNGVCMRPERPPFMFEEHGGPGAHMMTPRFGMGPGGRMPLPPRGPGPRMGPGMRMPPRGPIRMGSPGVMARPPMMGRGPWMDSPRGPPRPRWPGPPGDWMSPRARGARPPAFVRPGMDGP